MSTKQVKADKWTKMMSQEENMSLIVDFLEKGEPQVLVVFLTTAGQLQPTLNFSVSTKSKAVYFAKRLIFIHLYSYPERLINDKLYTSMIAYVLHCAVHEM